MRARRLRCLVPGRGLYEITGQVSTCVAEVLAETDRRDGLCTLFVRHTSASLVIQENADPAVQHDLENWMSRLAAENDPLYTHDEEGPDDMPAHIKSALTATSVTIPILDGKLALGTWQGIFLWEHRNARGDREVLVHVGD